MVVRPMVIAEYVTRVSRQKRARVVQACIQRTYVRTWLAFVRGEKHNSVSRDRISLRHARVSQRLAGGPVRRRIQSRSSFAREVNDPRVNRRPRSILRAKEGERERANLPVLEKP